MKNAKNRNLMLVATVAIQLCLGICYVWSVFQTGIANTIFGGDNQAAGLSYSIMILTLSFGSILGGMLVKKYSLKYVVMAGGILIAAGFFIASFTTAATPWLIWVTYGVMGGFGIGLAYSTTISATQKLFPDKKGLVTGIIVASIGISGVIFTPLAEYLISANGGQGVGELPTFRVLSYIFLVVVTAGSLFLFNPEEPEVAASGDSESAFKALGKLDFYLVTLSMMLACIGGLMMIGFAKPIAVGRGLAEVAAVGVLIISVFNAVGRLASGAISDKLGRVRTLMLLMIVATVLSLSVNIVSGYAIFAVIAAIGFCYGGLLSNFPTLTAEVFGARNMAITYGMVLVGFGFSAVIASNIGGYFANLAADDISLMAPAFVIAASCSVAGLLLLLLLNKRMKKANG